MITILDRFTDLPWWTATLLLNGNYSWKQYVRKLEARRANGFDTNRGVGDNFPSLQQLAPSGSPTPQFYRLDAKNIPVGGFTIDNGEPPAAGAVAPDTFALDGTDATEAAGRTEFYPDAPPITVSAASNMTAAFQQGAGTAEISLNDGAAWTPVASGVAVPANSTFLLRVRHLSGATFYCTFTLTAV